MNIKENLFNLKCIVFDKEKLETKDYDNISPFLLNKIINERKKYILYLERDVFARKKLKTKDIISFIEEIKLSLDSGLSVIKALKISEENCEIKEIKLRIGIIIDKIEGGENLTSAWEYVFPEEQGKIINILGLYEQSGSISTGLGNIATYLKEGEKFKRKMIHVLYYPLFTSMFTIAILIWFVNFFLPSMLHMLESILHEDSFSKMEKLSFFATWGVNLSAGFTIFFAIYVSAFKKWEKIIEKASYFKIMKRIKENYELEKFSLHFYHLINSGFSVIKVLEILKNDRNFNFCKSETKKCMARIIEGESIATGLSEYVFMGRREIAMIKNAEERGTLSESLSQITTQAAERKEYFLKDVLSYGEPFLMLTSGLGVGLVAYYFYKMLLSYTFTFV